MNPKQRKRAGKDYWRLLHNTNIKANYVKMLMVELGVERMKWTILISDPDTVPTPFIKVAMVS